MKHLIIFLGVALMYVAGCKKGDNTQLVKYPRHPNPYTGSMSAIQNGQSWNVLVYANYDTVSMLYDRFTLFFDRFARYGDEGDSILRETIDIGNLRYTDYKANLADVLTRDNPIYTIANKNEWASYDQYLEDGDVISRPHSLDTTEPHFIEITSYNPITNEVSGNFAMTFVSFSKKDTTRFTNGTFHTKIY